MAKFLEQLGRTEMESTEHIGRKHQQWQGLTLAQYVKIRNGVPLGDSKALRNMLARSFGAGTFAEFWQYWNPIWGYYLGKRIYSPLVRIVPAALALILTFGASGLIHDLVTMGVSRSITFFFTPWFFFLGIGVALGRAFKIDYSSQSWLVRASINFTYLLIGILLTVVTKQVFSIP